MVGRRCGLAIARCQPQVALIARQTRTQATKHLDAVLSISTPTLILPHKGGGDQNSLPTCGGGPGWGVPEPPKTTVATYAWMAAKCCLGRATDSEQRRRLREDAHKWEPRLCEFRAR